MENIKNVVKTNSKSDLSNHLSHDTKTACKMMYDLLVDHARFKKISAREKALICTLIRKYNSDVSKQVICNTVMILPREAHKYQMQYKYHFVPMTKWINYSDFLSHVQEFDFPVSRTRTNYFSRFPFKELLNSGLTNEGGFESNHYLTIDYDRDPYAFIILILCNLTSLLSYAYGEKLCFPHFSYADRTSSLESQILFRLKNILKYYDTHMYDVDAKMQQILNKAMHSMHGSEEDSVNEEF